MCKCGKMLLLLSACFTSQNESVWTYHIIFINWIVLCDRIKPRKRMQTDCVEMAGCVADWGLTSNVYNSFFFFLNIRLWRQLRKPPEKGEPGVGALLVPRCCCCRRRRRRHPPPPRAAPACCWVKSRQLERSTTLLNTALLTSLICRSWLWLTTSRCVCLQRRGTSGVAILPATQNIQEFQ